MPLIEIPADPAEMSLIQIPTESSRCQSLPASIAIGIDELLSTFLEFITFFDQADPRSISPDVLSEKCQALQKLLLELSQLHEQLPKEEFRIIVNQRRSTVLRILLGVYRNYVPGIRSMLFPEGFIRVFKDICQDPVYKLTIPAYYDRDFAVDCLRYEITTESAFPMAVILSTIISHIPKRLKQMDHWLTAGEDGELLLLNQIFACVTYLHPEICLAAVIKQQDFYTYLLTSVCSFLPVLDHEQIALCRQSLLRRLQSDFFLVTLFASDALKFLSGIASFGFASSLLMDLFPLLVESIYSERENRFMIQNLCTRLYGELPAPMKPQLLDCFPIRRHFFLWSPIPLVKFPDLRSQPEIFQELYGECMHTIESIFTATSATAMQTLVRLPLGLRCLASLVPWLEVKKPDEAPECSAVNTAKPFMRLFRFLTDESLAHLPLIKTSLYYLLRLGASLQNWLLDTDITEIIIHLKDKEADVTVLRAGLDLIISVLLYRKIGIGFCEHMLGFVAVLCCHENQLVKLYALSKSCWIAMHNPCQKVLKIFDRVPGAKENLCRYLSTKRMNKRQLVRSFATMQLLSEVQKQTKRPNIVEDGQETYYSPEENKLRKLDEGVPRDGSVKIEEDNCQNFVEENLPG